MMNKKMAVPVLFLAVSAIFAQTNLSVEKAVALALENNSSIEQGYTDLQGLKRKNSRSANGFTPTISAGAGVTRVNNNPSNTVNVYGTANVSFSLTSQAATAVKQAKLNYEAGLISYETVLRSVELSVRKAFYGLLYEQVYVDLQRRNLETSKFRYEQTLEKYRRGVVPELDVISAQVNYENLKTPLASAEISYKNNLASFKQLIGLTQNTEIILDGSIEKAIEIGQIILPQGTMSQNVRTLQKQLESAKYGVTSAKAGAYSPVLSLGFTYNPAMNSAVPSRWNDGGSFTASVALPIDSWLPWSQAKEGIDSAKDSVSILELQLEEARISEQVNIETNMRRIGQSMLSVENGRSGVDLARKSYEMMLDAYNRGTKDLLSLENSATALFEAEVSLMSQAYNLITAILDLENEVNVPFGTLGK